MKQEGLRRGLVLGSTGISLAGIYAINAGLTPLQSVSEMDDQGEATNYTLPADGTFAIWGVIYLGFLGYAVYQALPSQRHNPRFRRTGYLVAASILLNLAWTLLVGFGYYLGPYLVQWVMLLLALVLVKRWEKPARGENGPEEWVRIPFCFYAGWLTVAMIPFTTDLLQATGWRGEPLPPAAWAIGLHVAAVAIGYLTFRYLREPWYLLPIAWALLGIAIRFPGLIAASAGTLSLLVFALMLGYLSGLLPAAKLRIGSF